jgi:hypothetical protein
MLRLLMSNQAGMREPCRRDEKRRDEKRRDETRRDESVKGVSDGRKEGIRRHINLY